MHKELELSDYIEKDRELRNLSFNKTVRVAILSNFTINGLEETLRVKCAENKIKCMTYASGYNQYNQEILNEKSKLYEFKPDITFLILDVKSIIGNLFYFPYSISASERRGFVDKKIEEISALLQSFTKNSNSKLILTNFSVPTYSPHGIVENKTEYSFHEMIRELNSKLIDITKNESSIYVYDFDRFVTRHGENNIFDHRQFFFGDIKIALSYIPHLANDLMAYIKAITGTNRKCIVVDLDNTLWGGVIGEDGFDGIKLGSTAPGNAYVEFQRYLLSLWQKGILLAINSKNNLEDAMQVIREHPHMVLREENFASMRINWDDKAQNMKEIANELNLGLDSFVYFDDDPVNRANISVNIPEILTVDLPDDPSQYTAILMRLNDFNVLKITDEDLKRGNMYLQQKKRHDFEKSVSNLGEFLKQLDIKIKIKKANQFTIPRISQLTLKTNQFNLTTKRYQEEDIRALSEDNSILLGCAQIEDKFGDNGITGVFIVKKDNSTEWTIDTFLLSCRVMGRGIEDGILGYVLQKAKSEGIKKVKGKYVLTKKNKPCENFLLNYGFKPEGDYQVFSLDDQVRIPDHLVISEE